MSGPEPSSPQQAVDAFLSHTDLPHMPARPCPYLPGVTETSEAFWADNLSPAIYVALMNRGFRRSGHVVYRPACEGCSDCKQIRIPVATFTPSRSQRRVWRRNADLRVTVGRPEPTRPKWEMFREYLRALHDDTMPDDWEAFVDFLYDSPTDTREICYFLRDDPIAVSIVDQVPNALSSVYVYFDPRHARRSPGTYSALWEIDHCRSAGITYYYLGFYVAGARKMAYKARFRPCELLEGHRRWTLFSAHSQI